MSLPTAWFDQERLRGEENNMNHKNLVKKSSEKSTRAELFVQATQIIEQARPKKGRKTDDVDTVSA